MWHWLTNLLHHGKHAHKAAHHATKHVANLGQMASTASTVIGGVNAGITLYEKLKKMGEDPANAASDDPALLNEFLAHIENLEKTIQACESDTKNLKEKTNALTGDIQTLKPAVANMDVFTKKQSEELLKYKETLNSYHIELETLRNENKTMVLGLQKARKSLKTVTATSIVLWLTTIMALVFFYYKLA